jgi:hypothetical protein
MPLATSNTSKTSVFLLYEGEAGSCRKQQGLEGEGEQRRLHGHVNKLILRETLIGTLPWGNAASPAIMLVWD